MLFNSYIFVLLFLPLALVGYFCLNRLNGLLGRAFPRVQNPGYQLGKAFLLGMSLWFYAYFNPAYLWMMIASIGVNFGISRGLVRLGRQGAKKALLALALVANLGLLFYYKYYDFFVENLGSLLGQDYTLRHLVLPLGISFFTFQQISYGIDTYRGEVPPYPLLDYALFVTFFPQLIAGPIVTHDEMVPQFGDLAKKRFSFDSFAKGLYAFAFGMAKKVLLADTFGRAVAWGYGGDVSALGTTGALLVMLCYTFQIYFDFSGYCDMATGIGLMFNLNITQNFNSPYQALTITDFWSRWHITLTRFFRKYVYFPLGGNRRGKVRTYLNTLAVFLLSGLWHGANWTFVLWGGLHGAASVATKALQKPLARLHPALHWLGTFLFVNITWVYFRADAIGQAHAFLKQIYLLEVGPIPQELSELFCLPGLEYLLAWLYRWLPARLFGQPVYMLALWMGFALVAALGMKNTNQRVDAFRPTLGKALVTPALLAWCILSFSGVSTFLYFNF